MIIENNEDFPFDWKEFEAPEWANYLARDFDGNWYWFDRIPNTYKREIDGREYISFAYVRFELVYHGRTIPIIFKKP